MRRLLIISTVAAACTAPPPGRGTLTLDEEVDFGRVVVGQAQVRVLHAQNTGDGPIELATFEAVTPDDAFGVAFTPVRLEPGETTRLTVRLFGRFTGLVEPHEATWVLRGDRGAQATTTLKGEVVFVECVPESPVEFGHVVVGDTIRRTITLINTSALVSPLWVETVNSYGFSSTDAGTTPLLPGEAREVNVDFSPTLVGGVGVEMRVRMHELCDPFVVTLQGFGATEVLSCTPTDFQYTHLGDARRKRVFLSNNSLVPRTVTGFAFSPSPEFALRDAGTAVEIPAAQRLPAPEGFVLVPGGAFFEAQFTPTDAGLRTGVATVLVDFPKEPTIGCALEGFGGGPDIEVSPTSLSYGHVTSSVTKTVHIANAATANANLHWGGSRVEGADGGCYASAVSVAPIDLRLRQGLEPDAGVDQPITVSALPGDPLCEWDVVIVTDDPADPEVRVKIRSGN